jgi:hypothetical protein
MAAPKIKGSPSSTVQSTPNTQPEKTIAIQPENTGMLINRIYPNPASHYVSLNLQQDGPAVIHVVNTNGITVKETIIAEKSAELNISDLPAGLYLVKIIQQNKVRREKMLIER